MFIIKPNRKILESTTMIVICLNDLIFNMSIFFKNYEIQVNTNIEVKK
jgi:hypothetical protein